MTDVPSLPNACGRCANRWSGTRTAHCGTCHRTFSSPTAFDLHRIRRGTAAGTCADPADVGLVEHHRPGYAVWASPSDEAFDRFRTEQVTA